MRLIVLVFVIQLFILGYAGYYGISKKDYIFRNKSRPIKTKEEYAVISGYLFVTSVIIGTIFVVAFVISDNFAFILSVSFALIFAQIGIWLATMFTEEI